MRPYEGTDGNSNMYSNNNQDANIKKDGANLNVNHTTSTVNTYEHKHTVTDN